MGSSNQHKLLAEFNGVPLVKMAAQHLLSSKVEHIVVVTGFRHADIEATMHGLNLMILFNPDHDIGMGNSIAAGAKALLPLSPAGILIMPVDMPKITTEHVNMLVDEFKRSDCQLVVRGGHDGTPGHPVIIPGALLCGLLQLEGDRGARRLIEDKRVPVKVIEIGARR